MSVYDYERLLSKPAANDVERPFPPALEQHRTDPSLPDCSDGWDEAPSDGDGERLAA